MGYEHPLAYLLGVEGAALLRGFLGELDEEFVEARLAEIRRLLVTPLPDAVPVTTVDTVAGYRVWAPKYDRDNGIFPYEEPYVRRILAELPPGPALDAACGTGRYARILAELGHTVTGVDSSPDMLAHASGAEFLTGELTALPVQDDSMSTVVCALALTHMPALPPVLAEFARVLRPGGHLVISDVHHTGVLHGSVPSVVTPDGTRARLSAYRHQVGDYLRAALPLGFTVRACEEPRLPGDDAPAPPAADDPGPWELWPWSLATLIPEAARAAAADRPATIVWHFELT